MANPPADRPPPIYTTRVAAPVVRQPRPQPPVKGKP